MSIESIDAEKCSPAVQPDVGADRSLRLGRPTHINSAVGPNHPSSTARQRAVARTRMFTVMLDSGVDDLPVFGFDRPPGRGSC